MSHVRKSTIATEILEGVNRLQSENCTRWNSQLAMIQSVLNAPKDKLAKLKVPQLTTYERKVLAELVEILLPFLDATEFVQVEKYPSAGYILPCISGLTEHLEAMSQKHDSNFVRALQRALKVRMERYKVCETYIVASVLDPRFKLKWCCSNVEKISAKTLLEYKSYETLFCSPVF